MDGHFVPNISFGPAMVKTVHGLTRLPLDTHLMIENPDFFLEEFKNAGATYLTVHVEACRNVQRTISAIKKLGMKAGVSLKPDTPLSSLEEILPEVELILVMSVNPGFGGQEFLPHSIEKIRSLNTMILSRGLKTLIEVDGGVDANNAASLIEAGAMILVAGTAIFRSTNIAKAMAELRTGIVGK
jgi:ribulose-phosphate 3-epimerase